MQDIKDLFLLYHKNLYHYLLSLTHDPHQAEDLAAETFCKALQSLSSFKEQSSAKTWLFAIARKLWLQQLRKRGNEPKYDELLEIYVEDTLQNSLMDKETIVRINDLLSQKDNRTRTIVNMRVEGISYAEIGSKLGISEGSARVIDFRVKQWLKQIITKEEYI